MTTIIGWPADPVHRAELETLLKRPLPLYAGSVEMECVNCGLRILVGPRSASILALFPTATVYCGVCAVLIAGPDISVRDLGNQEDLSRR